VKRAMPGREIWILIHGPQAYDAPPEMLECLILGDTKGAGEEQQSQYLINILSDFKPDDPPLRPDATASLPTTLGNLQQRIAAVALSAGRNAVGGNGACPIYFSGGGHHWPQ
jgi:hypothetical protein